MSHDMFSNVTGAEQATQQPVWHQFLCWTPLIPARNRCAKPVARAVAFVLIAFVRTFIAYPWLDYEVRTVLIEKAILQRRDTLTHSHTRTHISVCLARHLRFNRGEVSLEVWLSHASLRSFSSSWKYRLVSPAKTHVILLLGGETENVHMLSYL